MWGWARVNIITKRGSSIAIAIHRTVLYGGKGCKQCQPGVLIEHSWLLASTLFWVALLKAGYWLTVWANSLGIDSQGPLWWWKDCQLGGVLAPLLNIPSIINSSKLCNSFLMMKFIFLALISILFLFCSCMSTSVCVGTKNKIQLYGHPTLRVVYACISGNITTKFRNGLNCILNYIPITFSYILNYINYIKYIVFFKGLVTMTLTNVVRTIFYHLRNGQKIVHTTFVRVIVTKP